MQVLKVGARSGQVVVNKDDLSRMARIYDPRHHEAPLFIGECGDTDPAVGWVSSLSAIGDALHAEITQLPDQIEKELKEGRRRIKKVGFYGEYGLRHVSLTGDPLSFSGSPHLFKEHEIYHEFQVGGVFDMNYQSERSFSEGSDAHKELIKKVLEIMDYPPEYDQYGRRWNPLAMSLRQHFEYVMATHPEVQKSLDKREYQTWVDMVRPMLSTIFCEQSSPGGVLQRETLKICLERGVSFGEAFSEAQRMNPKLAQLYFEHIKGL